MKFVELRHTDVIIGYLEISDRKQFFNYIGPFFGQENNQEKNNNLQLNFIHIIKKTSYKCNRFFLKNFGSLLFQQMRELLKLKE
jgi:hypothetical protein